VGGSERGVADMKPRLNIFTLALNAAPYIAKHLAVFQKLEIPWRWVIVHGIADPVADTDWCKRLPDDFQDDGTLYQARRLAEKDTRGRVVTSYSGRWPGKAAMCNAALVDFDQPGILLQVDADEIWTAEKLHTIVRLFETYPQCDCATFYCRYFIGPRRVVTQPGTYGNNPGEWLRAWRWEPGRKFVTHEPPALEGQKLALGQHITAAAGCVFDHYAYADEAAVAFKEHYYGYAGAVQAWRQLNAQKGPQDISRFLPWVRTPAMSYELP